MVLNSRFFYFCPALFRFLSTGSISLLSLCDDWIQYLSARWISLVLSGPVLWSSEFFVLWVKRIIQAVTCSTRFNLLKLFSSFNGLWEDSVFAVCCECTVTSSLSLSLSFSNTEGFDVSVPSSPRDLCSYIGPFHHSVSSPRVRMLTPCVPRSAGISFPLQCLQFSGRVSG